jgi:hypothetical protein
MKSGNLNFLELYVPPQACNGIALTFFVPDIKVKVKGRLLGLSSALQPVGG